MQIKNKKEACECYRSMMSQGQKYSDKVCNQAFHEMAENFRYFMY